MMIVIPAIDLRGGRCVRLTRGRYDQEKVYADDPAGTAERWIAQGARRLHVVDLDGARAGRSVNLAAVAEIAAAAGDVPVQLGGGLRRAEDIEAAMAAGADRVILGTRAVGDPAFLREVTARFPGRILVSLDVRGGEVAVAGWLEASSLSFDEALADLSRAGVTEIIVTDVERDGTLQGVDPALVRQATERGFSVLAAGGVGSLEDIALLKDLEPAAPAGVIVGKALYEGRLDLARAIALAGS